MRFVATSDTHLHKIRIPDGDVFIHAGDLCNYGSVSEFREGLSWIESLPHLHKIYVPGNHDRYVFDFPEAARRRCEDAGVHLLVCGYVTINDLSVQGFPWTRTFGKPRAFMNDADVVGLLAANLNLCTVLVSHGPPAGIYDRVNGVPIGCPFLRKCVEDIRPLIHIFGHNHHEHGGRKFVDWGPVEYGHAETYFANVAAMDTNNWPNGDPILTFRVERKDGEIKLSIDS